MFHRGGCPGVNLTPLLVRGPKTFHLGRDERSDGIFSGGVILRVSVQSGDVPKLEIL